MPGFLNRKGKGRGPCSRRKVGEFDRRHVQIPGAPKGVTRHVTKGRIFVPHSLREKWS